MQNVKRVNLALQGGGSHGAYTWGVIDSLLEDERISVEGVCGTSAGGMNATATVQGVMQNGNTGGRQCLRKLWEHIGNEGKKSPIKVQEIQKNINDFRISENPMYKLTQFISGAFSPYQLSPHSPHPLESVVNEIFDFPLLQKSSDPKLFLCATQVRTGKLKVFKGSEISSQAVLASACVPNLFKAIEVNEEFYWDGGFIGNPAIYPLIYDCESPDIIVIQIRRVHDSKIPTTVHDIQNRLGEITQNSCLTRELRAISFITKLIDEHDELKGKIKKLNMHVIRDDDFFSGIERASGFCADPDFLEYLFKAGRRFGKQWLEKNFDNIGKKTTADIESDFV